MLKPSPKLSSKPGPYLPSKSMPTHIPKCQLILRISYKTSSREERTTSVGCFTTSPSKRRETLWMIGVDGTMTTAHSPHSHRQYTLTKMEKKSSFLSKRVAYMPEIAKPLRLKSRSHQMPSPSNWDSPVKSTPEDISRPLLIALFAANSSQAKT